VLQFVDCYGATIRIFDHFNLIKQHNNLTVLQFGFYGAVFWDWKWRMAVLCSS